MTEWQPIETAPKDGTDIFVAGGKFKPMVAFWFRDGWVNVWTFEDRTAPNPTHWMPLPEPPK